MATSTQDMVRPGECVDLYYYDAETSTKQCFPTTINTKYVQNFANLTGGSSVFTIPPANGIQDVVCQFVMPALTGSPTSAGLALPRGWGYALIKQVSFRYGGSSQYFLTGQQILQNALRRQLSRQAGNDILTLGGNVIVGTAWNTPQSANVVLTLPHNVPSAFGKAHPFPTDLLTQQVQITVELFPISQVVSVGNTSSAADVLPTQLTSAQFLVQQVMLNNQGDALARRVDMATNAYAYPCEFVQQLQQIPLASGTGLQSVVLTGFRSGEVKCLQVWLSRTIDSPQNAQTQATGQINNPFNWQLPLQVIMTYAGEQYARFENASSPLLNLINDTKSPVVDNVASGVANTFTSSVLQSWVELPFAQTHKDSDSHSTLVHGKPITNGIINLQIQPPSSQSDWILNVSYVYNSTLLFSQGTVDYVF
jgi:hypothetical protein